MQNGCKRCCNTFYDPLPTVLAHMPPMLHALKVLFYAQICGHDYFRSRDKDGGHTIRSAVAEKPPLYANLTIGVASYGALGHVPPLDIPKKNFFPVHFGVARCH